MKTSVTVVLQGGGLVKTRRRCAARDRASENVCDSCAARDRASEDTQTMCCKGQRASEDTQTVRCKGAG